MTDTGPVAGDDGTPAVDLLAELDRRVAAAADAWLTDPRDVEAYRRLVEAVGSRRGLLGRLAAPGRTEPLRTEPLRPEPLRPEPGELESAEPGTDEHDVSVVPAVGEFLGGDPKAVLDRLRRGG